MAITGAKAGNRIKLTAESLSNAALNLELSLAEEHASDTSLL